MPLIFKNARTSVLLLPLLMVLTACDDNNSPSTGDTTDSGNTNVDSTPPTVISFSPSDGAIQVARDSAITATFSEDMFAKTIDDSSFIVASDREVSGTVSFDAANNVATFEPDRDLAFLVTYAATLSTAITDLSGNALATDQTWSFTTSDGTWGTAELIENDNAGDAVDPQIAVDGTGRAFSVWVQAGAGRDNIVSNRFDGSTWGTAELIESDNVGNARNPQIAVDGTGKAFAVWEQFNGTWNIVTNRFDGSAWGTAELIESDNAGGAFNPQIAVDGTGKAFAVWEQIDGTRNIVSNRFDGSTWGTAELIESDNAGAARDPQIAVDGTGKAFAVWQQSDGTRNNIVSNRFDGSTWGTAELIESDDAGDAINPQIAVDGTGKAFAVWEQIDGTRNIVSNRFDGSSWGTAELIESDDSTVFNPQIAVDGTGKALAVWSQFDGLRTNVVSNRFDGSTWGTAELIESSDVGDAYEPQIAVDGTGKALAVWSQSDSARFNIVSNRFDGSTWGTVELIESDDAGNARDTQIAVDGTGKAFAVWGQSNGPIRSIVSNRFE